MNSIKKVLHSGAELLKTSGRPACRLEAEILLCHCLGSDRALLYRGAEEAVPSDAENRFRELVGRRIRGEPVAQIIGKKEFWSLSFEVNRDVLIPRPETEILVEEALDALAGRKGKLKILDLCTGSGAIAVALASELPDAEITATDISPRALETAHRNAEKHSVGQRITFLSGDLFASVDGSFDLIAANPPYIAEKDWTELEPGVRLYEPREALVAGPDGMEFHRRIAGESAAYLKEEGVLIMEIGWGQGDGAAGILEKAGIFEEIALRSDYSGIPRTVRARRKKIRG
ncbi:MAG TPA: peptide chain release factor N(5)-glutamine methyltransferase [Syntrophales bacterium]|nr:peptide chain release factor N(5)-glutamine methyltransferase [Syntrophales bacterium]